MSVRRLIFEILCTQIQKNNFSPTIGHLILGCKVVDPTIHITSPVRRIINRKPCDLINEIQENQFHGIKHFDIAP